MTGVYVSVPIACFRKGLAREYLETEPLPPPATCYGFLLSLVGETDRCRHVGCRVTAGLMGKTSTSVVLRSVWRIKDKKKASGAGTNVRPDYQQLLTGSSRAHPFIELAVWLDSTEENEPNPTLEQRVRNALNPELRGQISRFGGLSFGESTHMVDSVSLLDSVTYVDHRDTMIQVFQTNSQGNLTLPIWVDHVGSAGTRYAVGNLVSLSWNRTPVPDQMPRITFD